MMPDEWLDQNCPPPNIPANAELYFDDTRIYYGSAIIDPGNTEGVFIYSKSTPLSNPLPETAKLVIAGQAVPLIIQHIRICNVPHEPHLHFHIVHGRSSHTGN